MIEDPDPVRITLMGNVIDSNAAEGVFFRGDSGMHQQRFVYFENPSGFDANGNRVLISNNTNFSPVSSEFTDLNVGTVFGNAAYQNAYQNLRTVQNTFLNVIENRIQNNGASTLTEGGLVIQVGTGSYVAADVTQNVFSGNEGSDFVTSSFLSAEDTFVGVNNTLVDTADFVYLDDTAQLDLRFNRNFGNHVAPSSAGAVFTNPDPIKFAFAFPGLTTRSVDLFQVVDSMNLDNPNNEFINFGMTQDIDGAFATGGYNLQDVPDFREISFPPFLP